MSRTYRKNPPQKVCPERTYALWDGRTGVDAAIPAVARDGAVVISMRREKGWARHETIVKHRAQCKQALYHDKELPRYPHTCGWVTW